MMVDASEKLYSDYQLTVTNPGGHSSLPRPDNAIYHLADGLARLERYQFPFELTNVTRAFYERMAKIATGERAADIRAILQTPPDMAAVARLSKDPIDNSIMHTTCVATRLNAGHANNALPQMAQANVNCRILPGHPPEEIRLELEKVVADLKVSVQDVGAIGGVHHRAFAPPPLRPDVFQPLEKVVNNLWPGLPVVPDMATGASDGVYTNAAGLPTYCISGETIDRDDIRAHGKDERIHMDSFYRAVDFYYQYLKAMTME
jgi:acetylornithine deacetylase/succinyl-diaminopimelate desuccinylase-like protein